MQHDDLIWSVIKKNHCAFRLSARSELQKFCSNVYNNTGLCCHTSCPLANSQYATIREVDGKLYLYMKVVERAAFPNRLWERVALSNNYLRSLQLISRHLAYWKPHMVFKVKQRFTRMKQYMVRKKRLDKREPEIHLEQYLSKHHKRERKLEHRALKAAKMEKVVENELKERLRKGVYSDIYNFDRNIFESLTADKTKEGEELVSDEEEYEEEYENVNEDDEPVKELVEEDIQYSDDEQNTDIEDTAITASPILKKKPKVEKSLKVKRKHKKVEFEYETETVPKKPTKLKLNF